MPNTAEKILTLAAKENRINNIEVRELLSYVSTYFKRQLLEGGLEKYDTLIIKNAKNIPKRTFSRGGRMIRAEGEINQEEITARQIGKLTAKFRDAGRRSPPWNPTSMRIAGRPQDGADGNRQNRWNFSSDHKYYASEVNATLVEIKYYLQTLSMENAPEISDEDIKVAFNWLLGHSIIPGKYLDPIQLISINFDQFYVEPSLLQSGHLIPLDRGGEHKPSNTFLMLHRSNQIQGNMTLKELVELMSKIVDKHRSGGIDEFRADNSDSI